LWESAEEAATTSLGNGRVAGVDEDTIYVLAPDPDSDELGCEGMPVEYLWVVEPATGERRPVTGDGVRMSSVRLYPHSSGRVVVVGFCEEMVNSITIYDRVSPAELVNGRRVESPPALGVVPTVAWNAGGDRLLIGVEHQAEVWTGDRLDLYWVEAESTASVFLFTVPFGRGAPVGDLITWAHDELVELFSATGEPSAAYPGSEVAVSPDQGSIAVIDGATLLVGAPGEALAPVFTGPGESWLTGPVWSDDGKMVAVVRHEGHIETTEVVVALLPDGLVRAGMGAIAVWFSGSSAVFTRCGTDGCEVGVTESLPPGAASKVRTRMVPYLQFGEDGLTAVTDAAAVSVTSNVVELAGSDLEGGYVWVSLVEGAFEHWWMPAGTAQPVPLADGVILTGVSGFVEGRPLQVIRRYVPDRCPEADYYWGEGLFALHLPTGEETFLFCDGSGPDGGVSPGSLGGDLLVGVAWQCWEPCSSGETVFWNLEGEVVEVAANPFSESCAPCEVEVLLSPDGRLLAYRHWPEAYWPDDRVVALSEEDWWSQSREIPADLVVVDLKTGEERFRSTVPAWTRLVDFDGRFLALETGRHEPWSAATIIDSLGENAPLELTGHIRLLPEDGP
jgi:hypothetical protein